MLKIALLGIGNAGNQVANLATREAIPAFCINASEKDLEIVDKNISTFIIGNKEGAGKDRKIAKTYVQQYYEGLSGAKEFDTFILNADIIFIVSSTGGGTGSGMSVLLTDLLMHKYEGKLFIPVGILPVLTDSIGAQRNTIEYLKEIKALGSPYLLYDNNKYKNLSPNNYMLKINEEIVEALKYIRGDFSYRTSFGMIDDADMLKLLTVPGMVTVVMKENFQEKDMEENVKLDGLLIKELKQAGVCMIDMRHIVKRIGVIVNLSDTLAEYYDSALTALETFVGTPFESFEHYYVIKEDAEEELPNRIAAILSGLPIPNERILMTIQKIEEAEKALSKTEGASILDKIKSLDNLTVESITLNSAEKNAKKDVDTSDIFNKY